MSTINRNGPEAIPWQATEMYEKKLMLVGLQECPSALSSDFWTDDVTN